MVIHLNIMLKNINQSLEVCEGCVYFPPNLPSHAYSKEDWAILQKKSCSFDFQVGDVDCKSTRKTSCSLVDLQKPYNPITSNGA